MVDPVLNNNNSQPDTADLLSQLYKTRIAPEIRKLADMLPPEKKYAVKKQFWPDEKELINTEGYRDDPLFEDDADIHPFPNIVHKYPGKLLFLTTDECPVYCRYCTRKRRTLMQHSATETTHAEITEYIRQQPQINEVIFSGGDPFMLSDSDLFGHIQKFAAIPQLRFLRFHTRTLTTLPKRFSQSFFEALHELVKANRHIFFVLVTHINMPEEIQHFTFDLAQKFRQAGIMLYNQSVLLSEINDSADILAELSVKLFSANIQPYYLHQLDRITGSAHFEVPEDKGRAIMSELRNLVPAYLVPKYVRDSKKGKSHLFY